MKLDKYTVPTGNRTPGRRMAVHYVTAEPRKPPLVTACSSGTLTNVLPHWNAMRQT